MAAPPPSERVPPASLASPVPLTAAEVRAARRRRVGRIRDGWGEAAGGAQVVVVNDEEPWLGLVAQRPKASGDTTVALRPLDVVGNELRLADGYACTPIPVAAMVGVATVGRHGGSLVDPPYPVAACPKGVEPCALLGECFAVRLDVGEKHNDVPVEKLRTAEPHRADDEGMAAPPAAMEDEEDSLTDDGNDGDDDNFLLPDATTAANLLPDVGVGAGADVGADAPRASPSALRALAATRHGGGGAGRASWAPGCERGRDGRWATSLRLAADTLERLRAELRGHRGAP